MIPLLNDANNDVHHFEEWHCDEDVADKKMIISLNLLKFPFLW